MEKSAEKEFNSNNEMPLITKNTSIALKGVFILMVLLHHLLNVNNHIVDTMLSCFGVFAVAGFFFLSGYGVMLNYTKTSNDYLKKFAFKRIPYVFMLLVVTSSIYLVYYCISNSFTPNVWQVLSTIFYITSSPAYIKVYSWIYFLTDLLYYYLIFLVLALFVNLIKLKDKTFWISIIYISGLVLFYLIYYFIAGTLLDMRAFFCFALGILFSKFSPQIFNFIQKNKIVCIVVSAILFLAVYILKVYSIDLKQTMAIAFCLFFVTLFASVDIKNKVVLFVGKISLYVYLSHGMFYYIFRDHVQIDSYLRCLIVIVSSIALSIALYYLVNIIKKAIKK